MVEHPLLDRMHSRQRLLLEIEPSCINARDGEGMTPLMVAAASAVGRQTINGIQGGTGVIDLLLLQSGADRNLEDSKGRTAYGIYVHSRVQSDEMMQALKGRLMSSEGQDVVKSKLMPTGGPRPGDSLETPTWGFVDYKADDRQANREMGIFDDDGDYYCRRASRRGESLFLLRKSRRSGYYVHSPSE
jgi:hypothetical protein